MSALIQAGQSGMFILQGDYDKAEKRLAVLDEQIKAGTSLVGQLFGIEQEAKMEAGSALIGLHAEREVLQGIVAHGTKYKKLSLEPLLWRDNQSRPLLVIFSLDSSEFFISHSNGKDLYLRPTLPKALAACFEDVPKVLYSQRFGMEIISLRCRFTGLIPPETRQKIATAKSSFKDIFIIAEPKDWKLERTNPDPLVVGWDGHNLWLIDVFDVSPVEEAMIWASGIYGQKTDS